MDDSLTRRGARQALSGGIVELSPAYLSLREDISTRLCLGDAPGNGVLLAALISIRRFVRAFI